MAKRYPPLLHSESVADVVTSSRYYLFVSVDACRGHMKDKGHCKVNLDDEDGDRSFNFSMAILDVDLEP